MIALLDYKAGNLTSVRKALAAVGAEVFTPERPADSMEAHGIIVPGVGHFAATLALDQEWTKTIVKRVADGRPLLGICLGMQWLFEGSDEAPDVPGLGLLAGRCHRLGQRPQPPSDGATRQEANAGQPTSDAVKIPHVGWNSLELRGAPPLVEGVPDGAQMYFTHSYVAPLTADTVAATEHGEWFASIVQRHRVAGVQFHPEKSGDVGLRILKNWLHAV